ncbi:probable E3 ubiquitin-protein ligase MID2 [Haliotis rubra]|uniref:probable E3 ubiquitin-protein ligase MID2 n=1 Tax=Haliotis rubra TaxID=36100 RepID=UPI001EE51144|nr:probable E3 ubiquitin-protein ligase MID2 [Haliotis rubra]XP_046577692.1 probable E3 ubiquitin-protein ligase MID2 [Haliotis rubra]
MSGSVEEKPVDFLTCRVCNTVYKDPCTLRCDHTFCRKCVTSYIQTRPDAVQAKTIPCPCCRQDTEVPHPSRPVGEWAGQIKPSIIIQRLTDIHDTEHMRTDTTETQHCYVCWELGETTLAALWCPDCEVPLCDRCVRTHRATPASREHQLTDFSRKPRRKRNRNLLCTEHTDEQVKFLCMDCRKLICQSCSVLHHRKCEAVVTIKSQLPLLKSGLVMKRKIIQNALQNKRTKKSNHELKMKRLAETNRFICGNIRATTEAIVENIKLKEQQLLDELDAITRNISSDTRAFLELEEIEMQVYRQHCEFIDHALVSDCEMDLYDAYQAWESGAKDSGECSYKEDTRKMDDIRFTPNLDNVQNILDDLQLGKIDVTYEEEQKAPSHCLLYDAMDGRTDANEPEPYLRDNTVLVVNDTETVVVTDWNEQSVKSFYTRKDNLCHSKISLHNSPFAVAHFKEDQVIVTIPRSRQMVTVQVTPDLHLLSTIHSTKGYYSVAVLNPSSLVAGAINCVDILDMKGNALRSITGPGGELPFTYPYYINVTSKGNILVSDCWKGVAKCLTSEGDVVWTYAPGDDKAISDPCGVVATRTGYVLLADRRLNKVVQLTEKGRFVRDVITTRDDVKSPLGLSVDRHGSLCVCDKDGIKRYILML